MYCLVLTAKWVGTDIVELDTTILAVSSKTVEFLYRFIILHLRDKALYSDKYSLVFIHAIRIEG